MKKAISTITLMCVTSGLTIFAQDAQQTLYNGIEIPAVWPPSNAELDARTDHVPPYLKNKPAVIPIDVGRQLFVDNFLIQKTTLQRTFHQPEKYAGNPILKPETPAEDNNNSTVGSSFFPIDSMACTFDDAVIYDKNEGVFKMWYAAGHRYCTALAYSKDGLHWERPNFDVVPGTNVVMTFARDFSRDSFSPILDENAKDPQERYKAFIYLRNEIQKREGGFLYTSPDGIHWKQKAALQKCGGDDTSLLYNPFRKKWGLSVRAGGVKGRTRDYYEADDFSGLAQASDKNITHWLQANPQDDPPDPNWVTQEPTEIYTLSSMPYESLTLGLVSVHYGPQNDVCQKGKFPKLTQIKVAFSRDGFNWDRSDHDVFIAATKKDGDPDRGYVRASGNGCLVVGDKLYFYYCGFSGYSTSHQPDMYAGGTMQVAMLRRDGFASMDAKNTEGELTTEPLKFSGNDLFVNLDAPQGSLRVEVLDSQGNPIKSYSAEECQPLTGDSTKLRVQWKNASDLNALVGQPVRFRFHLTNGSLYAFWVSPDSSGESNGFISQGPTEVHP
jgi:hypothetical protein